jgi:hypothetical protein
VDECLSTLSAKEFGSYDEVWGDYVVCRQIHLQLTTLRPDVSLFFPNLILVLIEIGALSPRRPDWGWEMYV